MGSRVRMAALVAVATLMAVAGVATAAGGRSHRVFRGHRPALSRAEIRRLSKGAMRPSIIIFKNQLRNLPARAAARAQRARARRARPRRGCARELARVHATHVHGFHIINAIVGVDLRRRGPAPAGQPRRPGGGPRRVPPLRVARQRPRPALRAMAGRASRSDRPAADLPAEPGPADHRARGAQVMNVDAAEQLVDGSGIKVGIVADGIDPNNPDLIRSNGQHVIFDYQDFSGFGTNAPTDGREAFLDAGHDRLAGQSDLRPVRVRQPGAPAAAGLQHQDRGHRARREPGRDEPVRPERRVLQLDDHPGDRVGRHARSRQRPQRVDRRQPAAEHRGRPGRAGRPGRVAAGVTVVATSGDAGPFNNIGSPATTPGVIAVGGTHDLPRLSPDHPLRHAALARRLGEQQHHRAELGRHDRVQPRHGRRRRARVTAAGRCAAATPTQFFGCADIDHGANPPPIWAAGGTSASAPETSGTAALVMQAYAQDARRRAAVAGAGQADHRQHRHRPRRARRPPGRRPRQHAQGRAAGRVDRRRQPTAGQHAAGRPDRRSARRSTPGQSHTFDVHVTNEGTQPADGHADGLGRPTTLSATTPAA